MESLLPVAGMVPALLCSKDIRTAFMVSRARSFPQIAATLDRASCVKALTD
jgi:hypothetical protein